MVADSRMVTSGHRSAGAAVCAVPSTSAAGGGGVPSVGTEVRAAARASQHVLSSGGTGNLRLLMLRCSDF